MLSFKRSLRSLQISRFFGTVNIQLPDLGEGTKEATIKEFFVKVGDKVEEFDDLCEVFTDKMAAPIPSSVSGVVTKIHYDIDDVCQVGHTLIEIDSEDADPDHEDNNAAEASPVQQEVVEGEMSEAKRVSPSGALFSMRENVDWTKVPTTNRFGIVHKYDIEKYLKEGGAAETTPQVKQVEKKTTVNLNGDDVVVPVNQNMVRNATQSKSVPFFVYNDDYDITQLKDLGYTNDQIFAFFVKAASNSLSIYPQMNTHVDPATDDDGYIKSYVVKANHNITIDGGCIKEVESKSLAEILGCLDEPD